MMEVMQTADFILDLTICDIYLFAADRMFN
jgi:hypothetical protein